MSSTIYGGITKNGINIDDMVDDNRDLVFILDDKGTYFARLSGSRNSAEEELIPAIAAFSDEEPFEPIYGEVLCGCFEDYFDGFSFSKSFEEKLEDFKIHFNNFLQKQMTEEQMKLRTSETNGKRRKQL